MWNSKLFDQWRSYCSLKTPVLLSFFAFWNIGFVIAVYGFGDGFGSPITAQSGVASSAVCLCVCGFSLVVAFSDNIRQKLIETKRAHNYRARDFYLLSVVTFVTGIGMLFFPGK